jgi:type I restriction enzyme S subunit
VRLDCAKAALIAAEQKTVQFKSAFLKSVFPDPTKPPPTGWRKMSLGEVAEVFNGKTPPRAEQRPAGFPVLKIRDIAADGQFRGAFQSFVDDDYARQFPTQQIRENDILILNAAHTSTHVASKMCRAAPPFLGALATGEWTIIRPQTAKISPLYLHYFIASDTARLAVKQMVRGVHLYPKDVRTLELSLPLASKQERIAIKCEDFLSRLNRVHAKVKRVAEDTQKLQSHSTQAVFLA